MSETTELYPLCPGVRKLRGLGLTERAIAKKARICQASVHRYIVLETRPAKRNQRKLVKAGFCKEGDWA